MFCRTFHSEEGSKNPSKHWYLFTKLHVVTLQKRALALSPALCLIPVLLISIWSKTICTTGSVTTWQYQDLWVANKVPLGSTPNSIISTHEQATMKVPYWLNTPLNYQYIRTSCYEDSLLAQHPTQLSVHTNKLLTRLPIGSTPHSIISTHEQAANKTPYWLNTPLNYQYTRTSC